MTYGRKFIKMNAMKKAGLAACAAVLLLAGAFLLYRLGSEPLQDYDEATYAQVVHEALASRHYLSYTEGGVPFLEKPPLGFWAMEASIGVFGENAFAQRLPFALFGIATIAALMLLVYEVSKNCLAAALGGAVLATMPPFMEAAREVRLDVPLLFFIVIALYFFVRALQNPQWLVAFGAAVGLAFMTKSVVAIFAVIAALFIAVLYRRFDWLQNKYLYIGAAACLGIILPWHVWEWLQFKNLFWERYVQFNLVQRTQKNLFWTVTITNADYVWYLARFTGPWLAVCLATMAGVAAGWKRALPDNRRMSAAFVGTIAVIIAVFFTAKTKAPTYLLPVYPFAAAVIALGVANIRTRLWQVGAGMVLALVLLSSMQQTYQYAYHYDPYFSVVTHMTTDEYAVGRYLLAVPQSVPVYVFDNRNLGSIEYYSQQLKLLQLTATSTPMAGDYVVVTTGSIPQLAKSFPTISTDIKYQGAQVTLLQILSED